MIKVNKVNKVKTGLAMAVWGLTVFSFAGAAEDVSARRSDPKPTVEPAHSKNYAALVKRNRDYPEFYVGPTGIKAQIDNKEGPSGKVTVCGTVEGGPSDGKFENGDVIQAINGSSLHASDPRVGLGVAIGAAEASDGGLVFDILRGGQAAKVSLTIPVLGVYGKDWPRDCAKSKAIIRHAAEFIVGHPSKGGMGLSDCWAGLFLLSTGDDKRDHRRRHPGHR